MLRTDPSKLLKVVLVTEDDEVETPFAEDLGPAEGAWGSRRVRLANIPFLHAKPTFGDVIVVEPGDDGRLTWKDGERIAEDGGRWLLILDYEIIDGKMASTPAFQALAMTAEAAGIVVEGCFSPRNERPGRAYFAVPDAMNVGDVLDTLTSARLPVKLDVVHPTPDDDEDEDGDDDEDEDEDEDED